MSGFFSLLQVNESKQENVGTSSHSPPIVVQNQQNVPVLISPEDKKKAFDKVFLPNGRISEAYKKCDLEKIDKALIKKNVFEKLKEEFVINGKRTSLLKLMIFQREEALRKGNSIECFKIVGSGALHCLGGENIDIILDDPDLMTLVSPEERANLIKILRDFDTQAVLSKKSDDDYDNAIRTLIAFFVDRETADNWKGERNVLQTLFGNKIRISETSSYSKHALVSFKEGDKEYDHVTVVVGPFCLLTSSNLQIEIAPESLTLDGESIEVKLVSKNDNYREALLHKSLGIFDADEPEKLGPTAFLRAVSEFGKGHICKNISLLPLLLNTLLRESFEYGGSKSASQITPKKPVFALRHIISTHNGEGVDALFVSACLFERLVCRHVSDEWLTYNIPEFLNTFWKELFTEQEILDNPIVELRVKQNISLKLIEDILSLGCLLQLSIPIVNSNKAFQSPIKAISKSEHSFLSCEFGKGAKIDLDCQLVEILKNLRAKACLLSPAVITYWLKCCPFLPSIQNEQFLLKQPNVQITFSEEIVRDEIENLLKSNTPLDTFIAAMALSFLCSQNYNFAFEMLFTVALPRLLKSEDNRFVHFGQYISKSWLLLNAVSGSEQQINEALGKKNLHEALIATGNFRCSQLAKEDVRDYLLKLFQRQIIASSFELALATFKEISLLNLELSQQTIFNSLIIRFVNKIEADKSSYTQSENLLILVEFLSLHNYPCLQNVLEVCWGYIEKEAGAYSVETIPSRERARHIIALSKLSGLWLAKKNKSSSKDNVSSCFGKIFKILQKITPKDFLSVVSFHNECLAHELNLRTIVWTWDDNVIIEAFKIAVESNFLNSAYSILYKLIDAETELSDRVDLIAKLAKKLGMNNFLLKQDLSQFSRILCHKNAKRILGENAWMICCKRWLKTAINHQYPAGSVIEELILFHQHNSGAIVKYITSPFAIIISHVLSKSPSIIESLQIKDDFFYAIFSVLNPRHAAQRQAIENILKSLHSKKNSFNGLISELIGFINKDETLFQPIADLMYQWKAIPASLTDASHIQVLLNLFKFLWHRADHTLAIAWIDKLIPLFNHSHVKLSEETIRLSIECATLLKKHNENVRAWNLLYALRFFMTEKYEDAWLQLLIEASFEELKSGNSFCVESLIKLDQYKNSQNAGIQELKKYLDDNFLKIDLSISMKVLKGIYKLLTCDDWKKFWNKLFHEGTSQQIEETYGLWINLLTDLETDLSFEKLAMVNACLPALQKTNMLSAFLNKHPLLIKLLVELQQSSNGVTKTLLNTYFSRVCVIETENEDNLCFTVTWLNSLKIEPIERFSWICNILCISSEKNYIKLFATTFPHFRLAVKGKPNNKADDILLKTLRMIFSSSIIYRNNLENRNFGKEAPQNFDSEQAIIAERQGASEKRNYEAKPTQPKTDFSGCFGISCAELEKLLIELFTSYIALENFNSFKSYEKSIAWAFSLNPNDTLDSALLLFSINLLNSDYKKQFKVVLQTYYKKYLVLFRRLSQSVKHIENLNFVLEKAKGSKIIDLNDYAEIHGKMSCRFLQHIIETNNTQATTRRKVVEDFFHNFAKYSSHEEYANQSIQLALKLMVHQLIKNIEVDGFSSDIELFFNKFNSFGNEKKLKILNRNKSESTSLVNLLSENPSKSWNPKLDTASRIFFLKELSECCVQPRDDQQIQNILICTAYTLIIDLLFRFEEGMLSEEEKCSLRTSIERYIFSHAISSSEFTKQNDMKANVLQKVLDRIIITEPLTLKAYALFIDEKKRFFPKMTHDELLPVFNTLAGLIFGKYQFHRLVFFDILKQFKIKKKYFGLDTDDFIIFFNHLIKFLKIGKTITETKNNFNFIIKLLIQENSIFGSNLHGKQRVEAVNLHLQSISYLCDSCVAHVPLKLDLFAGSFLELSKYIDIIFRSRLFVSDSSVKEQEELLSAFETMVQKCQSLYKLNSTLDPQILHLVNDVFLFFLYDPTYFSSCLESRRYLTVKILTWLCDNELEDKAKKQLFHIIQLNDSFAGDPFQFICSYNNSLPVSILQAYCKAPNQEQIIETQLSLLNKTIQAKSDSQDFIDLVQNFDEFSEIKWRLLFIYILSHNSKFPTELFKKISSTTLLALEFLAKNDKHDTSAHILNYINKGYFVEEIERECKLCMSVFQRMDCKVKNGQDTFKLFNKYCYLRGATVKFNEEEAQILTKCLFGLMDTYESEEFSLFSALSQYHYSVKNNDQYPEILYTLKLVEQLSQDQKYQICTGCIAKALKNDRIDVAIEYLYFLFPFDQVNIDVIVSNLMESIFLYLSNNNPDMILIAKKCIKLLLSDNQFYSLRKKSYFLSCEKISNFHLGISKNADSSFEPIILGLQNLYIRAAKREARAKIQPVQCLRQFPGRSDTRIDETIVKKMSSLFDILWDASESDSKELLIQWLLIQGTPSFVARLKSTTQNDIFDLVVKALAIAKEQELTTLKKNCIFLFLASPNSQPEVLNFSLDALSKLSRASQSIHPSLVLHWAVLFINLHRSTQMKYWREDWVDQCLKLTTHLAEKSFVEPAKTVLMFLHNEVAIEWDIFIKFFKIIWEKTLSTGREETAAKLILNQVPDRLLITREESSELCHNLLKKNESDLFFDVLQIISKYSISQKKVWKLILKNISFALHEKKIDLFLNTLGLFEQSIQNSPPMYLFASCWLKALTFQNTLTDQKQLSLLRGMSFLEKIENGLQSIKEKNNFFHSVYHHLLKGSIYSEEELKHLFFVRKKISIESEDLFKLDLLTLDHACKSMETDLLNEAISRVNCMLQENNHNDAQLHVLILRLLKTCRIPEKIDFETGLLPALIHCSKLALKIPGQKIHFSFSEELVQYSAPALNACALDFFDCGLAISKDLWDQSHVNACHEALKMIVCHQKEQREKVLNYFSNSLIISFLPQNERELLLIRACSSCLSTKTRDISNYNKAIETISPYLNQVSSRDSEVHIAEMLIDSTVELYKFTLKEVEFHKQISKIKKKFPNRKLAVKKEASSYGSGLAFPDFIRKECWYINRPLAISLFCIKSLIIQQTPLKDTQKKCIDLAIQIAAPLLTEYPQNDIYIGLTLMELLTTPYMNTENDFKSHIEIFNKKFNGSSQKAFWKTYPTFNYILALYSKISILSNSIGLSKEEKISTLVLVIEKNSENPSWYKFCHASDIINNFFNVTTNLTIDDRHSIIFESLKITKKLSCDTQEAFNALTQLYFNVLLNDNSITKNLSESYKIFSSHLMFYFQTLTSKEITRSFSSFILIYIQHPNLNKYHAENPYNYYSLLKVIKPILPLFLCNNKWTIKFLTDITNILTLEGNKKGMTSEIELMRLEIIVFWFKEVLLNHSEGKKSIENLIELNCVRNCFITESEWKVFKKNEL